MSLVPYRAPRGWPPTQIQDDGKPSLIPSQSPKSLIVKKRKVDKRPSQFTTRQATLQRQYENDLGKQVGSRDVIANRKSSLARHKPIGRDASPQDDPSVILYDEKKSQPSELQLFENLGKDQDIWGHPFEVGNVREEQGALQKADSEEEHKLLPLSRWRSRSIETAQHLMKMAENQVDPVVLIARNQATRAPAEETSLIITGENRDLATDRDTDLHPFRKTELVQNKEEFHLVQDVRHDNLLQCGLEVEVEQTGSNGQILTQKWLINVNGPEPSEMEKDRLLVSLKHHEPSPEELKSAFKVVWQECQRLREATNSMSMIVKRNVLAENSVPPRTPPGVPDFSYPDLFSRHLFAKDGIKYQMPLKQENLSVPDDPRLREAVSLEKAMRELQEDFELRDKQVHNNSGDYSHYGPQPVNDMVPDPPDGSDFNHCCDKAQNDPRWGEFFQSQARGTDDDWVSAASKDSILEAAIAEELRIQAETGDVKGENRLMESNIHTVLDSHAFKYPDNQYEDDLSTRMKTSQPQTGHSTNAHWMDLLTQANERIRELEIQSGILISIIGQSMAIMRQSSLEQSQLRAKFQMQTENQRADINEGLFSLGSDPQHILENIADQAPFTDPNTVSESMASFTGPRVHMVTSSDLLGSQMEDSLSTQLLSSESQQSTSEFPNSIGTKSRKQRPAPIKISANPRRLLAQVYRSPQSPGHYEALETRIPQYSMSLLEKSADTSESKIASSLSISSWMELFARAGLPVSPSAWKQMYDEADEWPIEFQDEVVILDDIISLDRICKVQSFRSGQRAQVFISPGQFWLVRSYESNIPCYLPRQVLQEVCPHGIGYDQYFKVRKEYLPPSGMGHVACSKGEIVISAHAHNIDPSELMLGDQYHCVKTLDRHQKGYIPSAYLESIEMERTAQVSSSSRTCPCIPPQPYTNQARLLRDYLGTPGNYELKENDVVEVAHVDPGLEGFACVTHSNDFWQGCIPAILLSMHRRPQDLGSLGEPYVDLTPRFFNIREEGWFEGEKSSITAALNTEDAAVNGTDSFSEDVKRAWERNLMGNNPNHKTWSEAYDGLSGSRVWNPWETGIPGYGSYYIEPQDQYSLPDVLKDTLTFNAPGPSAPRKILTRGRSGSRRSVRYARSKSLIATSGDERWVLKHHPGVGYQHLSQISVDQCRGYESEPDVRKAAKISRKYIFRRTDQGELETVLAAKEKSQEETLHLLLQWGKRPGGKNAVYKHQRRLWFVNTDARKFPWGAENIHIAKKTHHRYQPYYLLARIAHRYVTVNFSRDYSVVNQFSSDHVNQNLSMHKDDWCMVVKVSSDDFDPIWEDIAVKKLWSGAHHSLEYNPGISMCLLARDLQWKCPFLMTAKLLPISPDSSVDSCENLILLRRSENELSWLCLNQEAVHPMFSANNSDFEINIPSQWVSFDWLIASGLLRHASTKILMRNLLADIADTPPPGSIRVCDQEWDRWRWLFPVKELSTHLDGTSRKASDGAEVGEGDWVYMADDGLVAEYLDCELFGRRIMFRLHQNSVQWKNPHLLKFNIDIDDDHTECDWCIVLKEINDGYLCQTSSKGLLLIHSEIVMACSESMALISLQEVVQMGLISASNMVLRSSTHGNSSNSTQASSNDTTRTRQSSVTTQSESPGTDRYHFIPEATQSPIPSSLVDFSPRQNMTFSTIIEHINDWEGNVSFGSPGVTTLDYDVPHPQPLRITHRTQNSNSQNPNLPMEKTLSGIESTSSSEIQMNGCTELNSIGSTGNSLAASLPANELAAMQSSPTIPTMADKEQVNLSDALSNRNNPSTNEKSEPNSVTDDEKQNTTRFTFGRPLQSSDPAISGQRSDVDELDAPVSGQMPTEAAKTNTPDTADPCHEEVHIVTRSWESKSDPIKVKPNSRLRRSAIHRTNNEKHLGPFSSTTIESEEPVSWLNKKRESTATNGERKSGNPEAEQRPKCQSDGNVISPNGTKPVDSNEELILLTKAFSDNTNMQPKPVSNTVSTSSTLIHRSRDPANWICIGFTSTIIVTIPTILNVLVAFLLSGMRISALRVKENGKWLHGIYWMALMLLVVSTWSTRAEWLDVNGLKGPMLVSHARMQGGWEWSGCQSAGIC